MNVETLRYWWRAQRYARRIDRDEIAFVRDSLAAGDFAIDIGAHKGAYSYWMSRAVGPKGRVLAFEMQPRLAAYLQKMQAAVGVLRPLTIENLGLSSTATEATFTHDDDLTHSPGARISFDINASNEASGQVFRTVRLDDYLAEHLPNATPRLIKCDVEGHELEVFRGAEGTLRKHHPTLIFECESRHHAAGSENVREVFAYLRDLGYHGEFFGNGGVLPIDAFRIDEHQATDAAEYVNNFVFKAA